MPSVIIGAGIIGLHVAHVLSEKGHDVYVLEKENYLAEHTSGRNSGVVHAGIFYSADSLKEKLCIEGNRLTYEWLQKLKVPHRPCGKWIVPEEGQEGELEPFFEKIRKLPIPAPRLKTPTEMEVEEPFLRRTRAVLVPSTGILDAAAYVKALAAFLEDRGVKIILNCKVTGVRETRLDTSRGPIEFDLCVNAAGLWADEIAKMPGFTGYTIKPCRGDYYLLNKQPVSRPVYHPPFIPPFNPPLPRGGDSGSALGLGVHLTPTLDGQTLLGPNAFFIENKNDYGHRSPGEAFEKAMRFYLPRLKEFRISEGYSGNRPKLYKNSEPVDDFVIEKKENWIHLLGIESPGLTAAPALAREVIRLI